MTISFWMRRFSTEEAETGSLSSGFWIRRGIQFHNVLGEIDRRWRFLRDRR
jgi:hypothetical protein